MISEIANLISLFERLDFSYAFQNLAFLLLISQHKINADTPLPCKTKAEIHFFKLL